MPPPHKVIARPTGVPGNELIVFVDEQPRNPATVSGAFSFVLVDVSLVATDLCLSRREVVRMDPAGLTKPTPIETSAVPVVECAPRAFRERETQVRFLAGT